MKEKETGTRKIKVLDYDVPEADLKAPLREVLARRGLRADLVIENIAALDGLDPDYADYANVYKYAFF